MKIVVMVAAERHPRNYYAWNHARWLVSFFSDRLGDGVLSDITDEVRDWSFRHHTDISGWSFLRHLLVMDESRGGKKSSSVLKQALELASSLQWKNESVWWFLRTMASSSREQGAVCERFVSVNAQLFASSAEGSTEREILDKARAWYETRVKDIQLLDKN
jgi:hypothetical protein